MFTYFTYTTVRYFTYIPTQTETWFRVHVGRLKQLEASSSRLGALGSIYAYLLYLPYCTLLDLHTYPSGHVI